MARPLRGRSGRRDSARLRHRHEADERFAGLALLVQLDLEGRQAEAGYAVSLSARGRGIAGRALSLLTDWAFAELGLERLELRIPMDNPASMRVAERCGYLREGILRSLYFKQGMRSDTAVYSRLASD